ncbi:hypothetical protein Ancab_000897 [Ancistrocladus abbreviatus]
MAGSCYCLVGATSRFCFYSGQIHTTRCCSNPTNNSEKRAPQLLKFAVGGVTEVLRLFSSSSNRVNTVNFGQEDAPLISGIEDVMNIVKSDYQNAYFVTGIFTSSIYADDCIFEDPTIKFRGNNNLQCISNGDNLYKIF